MGDNNKLNRLILIGNGFDLAHGLKTSYQHFIDDFWRKEMEKSYDVDGTHRYIKFNYEEDGRPYYLFEDEFVIVKLKYAINDISEFKANIIEWKNRFLEIIEKSINTKNSKYWSDIETIYYKQLVQCAKKETESNDLESDSQIEKLNDDFDNIKKQLEIYLSEQISILPAPNEDIKKHIGEKGKNYENILFLNFNYTNTESLYENDKNNIIHIHGELNNNENPMIFGYGDELAKDFQEIENLYNNNFLENTKSVKYLDTNNYGNLLKFIDKGNYEIFIFGHSCGNSDRTLLNFIFEVGRGKSKCEKIKVFYYQKNEYTDNYNDLRKNVFRQFTKKSKLRDIVKKGCPLVNGSNTKKHKTILEKIEEDMVLIDGGSFTMGAQSTSKEEENYDTDARKNEVIKKNTKVNDFKISKYPTTQEQWEFIMNDNPSALKGNKKLPVDNVSWEEVQEFIKKLNEQANKNYRLPTEAEWEFAARGGNKLCKDIYPGCTKKGELKFYVWYEYNSSNQIHPVGLLKPNKLGLYDMNGNVWEWCNDLLPPTSNINFNNSPMRGGASHNNVIFCRVSVREEVRIDHKLKGNGFRLACDINGEAENPVKSRQNN